MEKLISVIVPIYKVPEKYLKKCIDSIINQTLKNIEIILVDDESPDNCGLICDDYAEKDNRIKIIHQKNKGLCGARNSGVKKATGEWIMFVDGDDWIEQDMCEQLYKSANSEIDIICCGVTKDYGSVTKDYNYDKLYKNNKVYETEEELKYMRRMLLNFNGNISTAYAKLINRKFVTGNNIYHNEELRQGAEGLEFNIRLFNEAKKIKFIKNILYHYMYNDNSITTTHNEENHKRVLACFEEIRKNIDNNDKEMMKWFYNRLCYVIVTTAISGYFSPNNKESYKIKKEKFEKYLKNEMLIETLRKSKKMKIDFKRKIILNLIKYQMYISINLIAKIKFKCKNNKCK